MQRYYGVSNTNGGKIGYSQCIKQDQDCHKDAECVAFRECTYSALNKEDRLEEVFQKRREINQRQTNQMVLFSAWAGSKGCDAKTGRLLNDTGIGWNVITSRGDLRPEQCSNIYFSLTPGGRLTKSTIKLECRGASAFVKLFSYGSWTACNDDLVYHGLVFPNGYNCSARAPGFLPLYELSLTSDVCSNKPIPKIGGRKLEFAAVQNVYIDWVRGIGSSTGNATYKVVAGEKIASWGNGVQVMLLNGLDALDKTASDLVTLSVETVPASSGIRWGRKPVLLGTLSAKAVQGVASFGADLGIKQAGSYKFKACIGATCVLSNVVQVLPQGVTRTVLLGQPASQTFKLVNANSGNADFGKVPINVTWTDAFGNSGAQVDLYNAMSGVASMNVTCSPIGDGDNDKMVWTEQSQWGKRGYAEFYSMGNLKDALDDAFGAGVVAGNLEGWSCFGQINMGREWRDRTRSRSVKTNTWKFVI